MGVEGTAGTQDKGNQEQVIDLLQAALDEARGEYDLDKLFGLIGSVDFLLVDDARPLGWASPGGGGRWQVDYVPAKL